MNTNLTILRDYLKKHGVDAMIVPTNDPHFSEYVSDTHKCREWLTGFTGSAGAAVVTQKSAALFTDSRYFLQAAQQLENSGFELKKEGLPETESIAEYLKKHVGAGKVAVDGSLYSSAEYEALAQNVLPLTLTCIADPFSTAWTNRPAMPSGKAFLLPEKYSGKAINEKLQALKTRMNPEKGSIYTVSALDEIAWLLNLRGSDVSYTPVVIAYAVVDFDAMRIHLFTDKNKLNKNDTESLQKQNVAIHSYADFATGLARLSAQKTAVANFKKTSVNTLNILKDNSKQVVEERDKFGSIASLKAVKNSVEIAGTRQAMIDDGAAWVKFWEWLEEHVDSHSVTEINAAEKLCLFRAECKDFLEQSFSPIVGYKEHGAIVHYGATLESNIVIGRETFLLVDTGAQYPYGTTDITRTLHLGKPTKQEKMDYTLVLQGHIQLSLAKFPHGTRGAQLDMLARQPMMQHMLHYMHGTGHGVGHCLGVHEGPQSIRLNENPALLESGMITSCEPGIYRAGRYGIRIENLILTIPYGESEFGKFLQFEPLTLCPYDLNSIETGMLSPAEKLYINSYHLDVYEKLKGRLQGKTLEFLKAKTQPIS
ncbi:MAG: aminopeptidase P family protein [Prevotellaceae bacterium]|jgi:Xaa-Pro aminopeptidase|nr:aminopeptidase P family protein [Prevotellaceae bacterium]